MNNEQTSTEAVFYTSGYLADQTRALIVAGVDFLQEGIWITEAYSIFTDASLSGGVKIRNSYDPRVTPADCIPSLEVELADRLKFAESFFWMKLREKDKDAALWLRGMGGQFAGPLTDYGVARAHLRGDFGNQIVDVLCESECRAIRRVVESFQTIPKFRTKRYE